MDPTYGLFIYLGRCYVTVDAYPQHGEIFVGNRW